MPIKAEEKKTQTKDAFFLFSWLHSSTLTSFDNRGRWRQICFVRTTINSEWKEKKWNNKVLYLPQYGVHLQRDHLSKTADEKVARLTALWVQYFMAAITVRAASVFLEPISASLACLCVHVRCTYVLRCFLDRVYHRSLSFWSHDALSSQHSMSFCSVVCCFSLLMHSFLFLRLLAR